MMPYDNRSNPQTEKHRHMSHEENMKNLHKYLDEIATYLYAGAHWHLRAANYSRKNKIRGFGRWHDCEAKGDFCALMKLEKIVNDKLGYMPLVDMADVAKAEAYEMPDANSFRMHFDIWEHNEKELVECLNHAIHAVRAADIQIYKELLRLAEEVQDEIMRSQMAKDSLTFGGWNPHDISIKSMLIHKYFEEEHSEGSEININLG